MAAVSESAGTSSSSSQSSSADELAAAEDAAGTRLDALDAMTPDSKTSRPAAVDGCAVVCLVAVVAALQFRPRLTSAILSHFHTRTHTRSTRLRRARYLRAVHVEYCPFTAGSCGPGFLSLVRTPRVAEVAPKLEISHALLRKPADGATPPPEKLTLKFVDGATRSLDLSANRTQDVLEEIDLENGRLDTEALQRGKPWA